MAKINFGAGPAKLPEEVLKLVQEELVDFRKSGISLMETSHRAPLYMKLNQEYNDLVRKLLNVPDNYKILFAAGGGTGEFAAVPLNLISRTGKADYFVTGAWSKKAAKEAEKYGKINIIKPAGDQFVEIPRQSEWNLDPEASYVHICDNETIHGVAFYNNTPDTKGVPLVADMSSSIMSKKIDVSKYGVIYAGAQKNIGPSGVTLVIVRDDLLEHALPITPQILDWKALVKANSILNTPPVFAIYVMGEVFKWIERMGGVAQMEMLAIQKSSLVYSMLEASQGFYSCPVKAEARSRMNVPFRIGTPPQRDALEKEFLAGAEARGLLQLKGHRDVGGLRASLYNAVTVREVEVLVDYMKEFMNKHKQQ